MPMPVSCTHSSKPESACRAPSVTVPRSVNLIALPSRLVRICRTRSPSPCQHSGTSAARSSRRSSPLRAASTPNCETRSCSSRSRRNGADTIWNSPLSSLAASSTSLRMRSSARAASRMVRACSRSTLPAGSRSRSSSAKPTMAFIGVRISWLTLAKKALRLASAFSSSRWVCCSARTICTRSVTSKASLSTDCTRPSSSSMGWYQPDRYTVRPSLARRANSPGWAWPRRSACQKASMSASWASSVQTSRWGRPASSSGA